VKRRVRKGQAIGARLDHVEPALRDRVVVRFARDLHHLGAVVDRGRSAAAPEGLFEQRTTPTAHLEQVVVSGKVELAQENPEVGPVVKRVAVDVARRFARRAARQAVREPVPERSRRGRLE
jgi:hypothetical protein